MRVLMLSVLALTGCVSVHERQLGTGTHEIATSAVFPNNYNGAQIALDNRAGTLCPSGYEKTSERKAGDDLVWTVRCN